MGIQRSEGLGSRLGQASDHKVTFDLRIRLEEVLHRVGLYSYRQGHMMAKVQACTVPFSQSSPCKFKPLALK